MIPIPRSFREFIQLLNRHRVRYVVIGGYAVAFHGYPRYTGDLDVFVEISLKNAAALARVLEQFGLTDDKIPLKPFLTRGTIVRTGREPMRLEIINKIDGATFAECFKDRLVTHVGDLRINFIGLVNLRRNKRAAGRPKDLDDLKRLPRSAKKRPLGPSEKKAHQ